MALALVLGLAVRAMLVLAAGELEPRIVDEQHYLELAQGLDAGRGFAWSTGQPTSLRPPLFPALVAVVWGLVGGQSLTAVRVVQMGLALATVWLVYRLGTAMFDEKTGALAALGASLYPSLLFANVTLLTETLFTFLLLLTVWLWHLAMRDQSLGKMGLAGACCALAALTRSVVWPFPVVGGLVVLATGRGSWQRRLGMAAVFCLCHALVLAPWAVRNTKEQRVFTVVDTISGFNLWMANSEATPPDRIWAAIGQGAEQRFAEALALDFPERGLTEGQKDHWGRRQAFRYMAAHPVVTVQRSFRKFADFWGLDRELLAGIAQGLYAPPWSASLAMGIAVAAAYPVTMILAALGIGFARKNAWPTHVLVGILVLFVCALHSLVFGHSRYRLPLMPFMLIYAAAALQATDWRTLPGRWWRGTGVAATIAVLGVIWIQEVLVRDADRIRALLTHLAP